MSSNLPRPLVPSILALAVLLAAQTGARANEGQWKPSQIAQIHDRAARDGLELTAEQLWNGDGDEHTGGLMRASINYGGCSAAFISPEGLIATNHHCAYGALQANSSVDANYVEDGFLAADRGGELHAPGRTVKVLRSVEDVTPAVEAALDGVEDDGARADALRKVRNELVDACEAEAEHVRCTVAEFFLGTSYELHTYVELTDVRLVYAPPSAIGEYGGETDNWMWPRHTGDFSLLRAYVGPDGDPADYSEDNVPYQPKQWLKPATSGVSPGDFVAILGYPGHTDRYLWAAELERHQSQWLPQRVIAYGEWIDILDAAGRDDEAVAIKVAATKKSLANRHKNARGKIAGLEKMDLLSNRQQEDARLKAREDAKDTLEALEALSAARAERGAKAFLLHNLGYAPRRLAIAMSLVRWAAERDKPDVERRSGYRDRDRDSLGHRLDQLAKDYDANVDTELLASFMRFADALAEGQRSRGFDAILGDARGKDVAGPEGMAPYRARASKVLDGQALTDSATIQALLDDPKPLKKSKDPMVALARALVEEADALETIEKAEAGRLALLGPAYFALIAEMRSQPAYSDANRTLRLSHATVQGYDKWDGSTQSPQTTLAGAVAKHTGEGEFDLPDALLEAAQSAKDSVWFDPELGDVPVCFLANGDTTGGNSGSPVINGAGELVGFNFDRVWENVAGDYAWRPGHSRNVISDARYLYWVLGEVASGEHLLKEMGVADYQPPPRPDTNVKRPREKTPVKPGCACSTDDRAIGVQGSLAATLGLLALLGLRRRRRGRDRDA